MNYEYPKKIYVVFDDGLFVGFFTTLIAAKRLKEARKRTLGSIRKIHIKRYILA